MASSRMQLLFWSRSLASPLMRRAAKAKMVRLTSLEKAPQGQ